MLSTARPTVGQAHFNLLIFEHVPAALSSSSHRATSCCSCPKFGQRAPIRRREDLVTNCDTRNPPSCPTVRQLRPGHCPTVGQRRSFKFRTSKNRHPLSHRATTASWKNRHAPGSARSPSSCRKLRRLPRCSCDNLSQLPAAPELSQIETTPGRFPKRAHDQRGAAKRAPLPAPPFRRGSYGW